MTIRVAAVGLGWVAQNRHLPTMDRASEFEVVGVIDRRPDRARGVADARRYARHACAERLASVDWLDEVDAVTVSTAPMAHHALIEEALSRGKHVLTEKPFTMTRHEGLDLLALADARQRRLAIVHNFQFARSTSRLFGDVANGRLGAIKGVDAVQFGNPKRRLPEWCEDLPLGLFYDESPHLLYLLRALAPELTLARSLIVPSSTGLATPSRLEAWFKHVDLKCPIRLSCNFESPVSEWYFMVSGSEAIGIVDIFRDIYLRLPNDGRHDTKTVLRTSVAATVQHWVQHLTSGLPHLTGRLSYGNAEVFDRFARGIGGDAAAMAPIDATAAQAVLELQHAVIDHAEDIYA